MLESCAYLQLQPPAALADILTELITDIRRVLVAEMQNDAKLARIFTIVDAAAPPPPPGGSLPARGPAG